VVSSRYGRVKAGAAVRSFMNIIKELKAVSLSVQRESIILPLSTPSTS
jgi:hypothetical protein